MKPGFGMAGRDGVGGTTPDVAVAVAVAGVDAISGFMKRGRRGVIPLCVLVLVVATAGDDSEARLSPPGDDDDVVAVVEVEDVAWRLVRWTGRHGRVGRVGFNLIVFNRRSNAWRAWWPVVSLHIATRAGRLGMRVRLCVAGARGRRVVTPRPLDNVGMVTDAMTDGGWLKVGWRLTRKTTKGFGWWLTVRNVQRNVQRNVASRVRPEG